MQGRVRLTVNGVHADLPWGKDERLIDLLRNRLNLKGTRFGCGEEICGACVVLVDGVRTFSCTYPAEQAADRHVTTIEGLGAPENPHALQRAFLELQAGQCGYCLSGIMMSAAALLEHNTRPSRAEIVKTLDQHLCRCGVHNRIISAVERAAQIVAEEQS